MRSIDAGSLKPLPVTRQTAVSSGSILRFRQACKYPAKAVALAGQGSALTTEIAKLVLMKEDSPTRFKGKPGVDKRVAWADPLPLSEVKAIGRALNCSVNDVLLSSVAGALRAYLKARGDDVTGVSIRAMVPVNLRPPEKAWKLGNRFGFRIPAGSFFLWLDVGDGEAAAVKLWREGGVRVLPGGYLTRDTASGNPGKNFIRVALVNDLATTREALDRIARIL